MRPLTLTLGLLRQGVINMRAASLALLCLAVASPVAFALVSHIWRCILESPLPDTIDQDGGAMQISPAEPQQSFAYDPTYADPAISIPQGNALFAKNVTGLEPDQIHITYVSPTSVVISWATGDGLMYAPPVQSYQVRHAVHASSMHAPMSGAHTLL